MFWIAQVGEIGRPVPRRALKDRWRCPSWIEVKPWDYNATRFARVCEAFLTAGPLEKEADLSVSSIPI